MSQPYDDPEQTAALAVLDGLGRIEGPDETSIPDAGDEVERGLRRLFVEATGLVPYSLAPAAPDPALRGRILTSIVGDLTQEVRDLVAPPAAPAPPPVEPAPAAAAAPLPYRAAQAAGGRGWRGRLAAAAGVLLVAGLAFWIAFLQSELRASRARLAWVEREWRAAAEASRLAATSGGASAPASTIFPLHCPTGRGRAAGAHVYVVVPPDRARWELTVDRLVPEPPNRDYQVWFLVGDRPTSGGCLNMQGGRPVLSMVQRPPAGVTGVAVTIEPKGGSPQPTGETILVADQPIRL